ncbi:hypothetical protein [Clostridioides sp. ZZV14-6345]|uniref:hypothetical protein n=1 Tax=Clostridioides sp. ZZV14-6345 TaxID=2811496 RepID=UPI001D110F0C|nr:hypothetical protein [Clostridioides sp. ZZV14-6345]
MENCVYMFVKGFIEVLYVGKAKNLNHRLNNHSHLPNECYTEGDMELAERYFISKYKPVYNDKLLKKDITIEIENFNKLKFEEYKGFKKITKKNSFLRDLEPYIKNNSYEMYTTKSGKRCYRVNLDFIEELSELQEEDKIYIEYNCCESMKKIWKRV